MFYYSYQQFLYWLGQQIVSTGGSVSLPFWTEGYKTTKSCPKKVRSGQKGKKVLLAHLSVSLKSTCSHSIWTQDPGNQQKRTTSEIPYAWKQGRYIQILNILVVSLFVCVMGAITSIHLWLSLESQAVMAPLAAQSLWCAVQWWAFPSSSWRQGSLTAAGTL